MPSMTNMLIMSSRAAARGSPRPGRAGDGDFSGGQNSFRLSAPFEEVRDEGTQRAKALPNAAREVAVVEQLDSGLRARVRLRQAHPAAQRAAALVAAARGARATDVSLIVGAVCLTEGAQGLACLDYGLRYRPAAAPAPHDWPSLKTMVSIPATASGARKTPLERQLPLESGAKEILRRRNKTRRTDLSP